MKLHHAQEAADQLGAARAALDARLPDTALAHLCRALELDPALPEARLLEARLHLESNAPARALTALDAHDLYFPEQRRRPDIAMLRVEAMIRAEHNDLALSLLGQLAGDFPDDVRPHRMTAGLCLKLHRHREAEHALRQVLRLEPTDRNARVTLAQLLTATKPEAAIDLLQRKEDANDPTLPFRLARLYRLAGRFREARDVYDTLLRRDPDAEAVHHAAGTLADDLGDYRGAIEHLQNSWRLSGRRSLDALIALATAHMHAGESATAARVWWRAIQHRPEARSLAGLLVCALAERRYRLVRRVHKMLSLQTSKQERRTLLLSQWVRLASGIAIRRAGDLVAADAPRESALGELLSKAEETLAAATIHQGRADTEFHLAICRTALGDRAGANDALTRAIQANPRYAAAIKLREELAEPLRQAA